MCPPQFRNSDPMSIPNATLAMAISQKQRKIYYIPVFSSDFDYGTVALDIVDKAKFGKLLGTGDLPPLSFMVSYDLASGRLEDIGLLRGEDGRYAYGMQGAKVDADGKVWFVGAFEEPNPDYVARKIRRKFPYSMGLGCYDPHRR
jgi:hypothetical protein